MEELKFRKLKLSDMCSLFFIEAEYFPDNINLEHWCIDFLYDPRFSFVCSDGKRIVGFIRAEENKSQIVEIQTLCVTEEFSRCGIGKKLMNLCIESIRKAKKYVGIVLMVRKSNTIATNLYKSMGFEIKTERRNAYFDGSDGFIMELTL